MPDAAQALALTRAAEKARTTILVLCRDSREAQELFADARALAAASLRVSLFPDWETLPYDLFSPHPDIVSDRVRALYDLAEAGPHLLIASVGTVLQRLAPRSYIRGAGLNLAVGDHFDIGKERSRLEDAGYQCVPQVTDHGEFAVRGALFDLFPMGAGYPFRVELFDNDVESIRTFDPETQLSRERIDAINLLPAREFPFDEAATEAFRVAYRHRFDINLQRSSVYQDVKNQVAAAGIEYYLPLFFEKTESLFNYLPADAIIAMTASIVDSGTEFLRQVEERFEDRRHDIERPILRPDELYFDTQSLLEMADRHRQIALQSPEAHDVPSVAVEHVRFNETSGDESTLAHWCKQTDHRVVVAVSSAGRRELVAKEMAQVIRRPKTYGRLDEFIASDAGLGVCVAPLSGGFSIEDRGISILTERQLRGIRLIAERAPRKSSKDAASVIRDLEHLSPGAPVVHEDYGVGRYLGLTRLDAGGMDGEFLTLEYAEGDKLYVPVASLHLISRYTGADNDSAPLHKLKGDAWEKVKKRAAERARDVAAELLEIYARREAREGHAVAIDEAAYRQFADGFPFEETPDQAVAIAAVLADLSRSQPMDRVVCGDVGFGKTEVAMRAAFAVAHSGKQVAMLVPTTLLAQQHYQNFSDRFADWPLRVEVLSRFRTKSESDQLIRDLQAGKVDIVIGTHRLLQKDLRFSDLGLLIIDEEHRFGVRDKERLKKLRAEVDQLTLTATPIPRTLNMAMSGMRDLSIIATPPARRMPVKTFVKPWNATLIRDAVERELQRGGQIYFLHNKVETIGKTTRELGEMFPAARIRYAHGQMREKELESIMLDFHQQRFNILVCTTIIESGIDIPSANTIIINRADRFGLAQLHQLRGRVGRSHHRAFAYLIVPDPKAMTSDARKRLEALESLDDLGVGFTLATHDLEIRGAGELLGDEQSGQIHEVGFSLYSELLSRAVKALKSGQLPEDTSGHGADIDLHVTALIPDDWIPDVHTRLVLYKRIAGADSKDALEELQVEMIDRFGLLPEPVKNLFSLAEVKLAANSLGVRELSVGSAGGKIVFEPKAPIEPLRLIQLIQSAPKVYRFDGPECLRFTLDNDQEKDRFQFAWKLLQKLEIRNAA